MSDNINVTQESEAAEEFSLKDFLACCLSKWRWFTVSIVLFCCLGVLYVLRQQPVYSRSMELLIKDQDGGGGVADISNAFSSLGLVSSNTNVNNELISLSSPAVMYEVVKNLGLDVNYSTPGRFHEKTLYGSNLPVNVKFHDLEEQQCAGFRIELGKDGNVVLSKFHLETPDGDEEIEKEVKAKIGAGPIETPVGKVSIAANGNYTAPKGKKNKPVTEIIVERDGMQSTVETYGGLVKADLADKDADVIDLSMKDVSTQRAVDVLNEIVAVYNDNWVYDKNRVAVATSSFIDDRLRLIERELGNVDNEIFDFKRDHRVPNLEEAAKTQMKQSVEMSNKMLEVTNQMSMSIYLRDYLNNPGNAKSVIPVNTGIGSPTLEAQISNYNNLLLTRNTLAASSSDTNPLVVDYDGQIKGLREAIVNAINGQIVALNKSLRNMEGAKGAAESQLASGSTQAKYLLSVERQKKVKESLYLYLLQKREENELTQKFTADNTRIITPPTGSLQPVAPKVKFILAICMFLGLCVPGVAIYIISATDTKVRSRKDLDRMSAPFAGEIPFVGKKSIKDRMARLLPAKKNSKELERVVVAVKEGSRDAVSESFRIVRGNIDFMIRGKEGGNVIMITSFNPGSGKSFISFNLSASFALKGKKVLVVDGDLRHGSASQFVDMPSKGLSNYLTGNTDNWQSLVVPVAGQNGMSVMPIGHRPPNPSELLDNGRIGQFLDEARKEYDYIFVDCPPTDVVVDTQIVEKYVDRTIFVVRAGLLDRKALEEIDAIYRNKRFKQMSIVLNGTEAASRKSYGAYGYYG